MLSRFTKAHFDSLCHSDSHKIVVAEEQGFIRGFALINLESVYESPENGFEIEHLYIHQPFRKAGFGLQILEFIKQNIGQPFWLYTWVDNKSNSYYEHVGFQHIGTYVFRLQNWDIENHVYRYRSV